MNIAIIGTGYVGLVSGACFAERGHQVTCVDVDQAKIERLLRGEMPIFEHGLAEIVAENVKHGRLRFTTDYAEAIPSADVILLAVGTPPASDGTPNMQYLFSAIEAIRPHLTGEKIIVTKSTVPVGTEERIAEVLERKVDIVSNPEMLREGKAVQDFMQPSRVVVGVSSDHARDVMERLYAAWDCPKFFMSTRSAELTKYAANAFLATKISFVNEIAHIAEEVGANIEEIAQGIGADPRIGKDFLRAGLGWGGSCFPKDVSAIRRIAEACGLSTPVISAAVEMNGKARKRIVDRLKRHVGEMKGKTIALLGLSFKGDTDDTRESPAMELLRLFVDEGATVQAFDPEAVVTDAILNGRFLRTTDPYLAAQQADALVIATEWNEFRLLDVARLRQTMRGTLIFDARNLLDPSVVREAGLTYLSVGRV